MPSNYPNPVVTFLPVHEGAVLLIKRPRHEQHYAGKWAFPGGRVETGETVIDALLRELAEETGLTPSNRICFLDSYAFGNSVGIAFAVETTDKKVGEVDGDDFTWVDSIADMQKHDRIAGIDSHLAELLAAVDMPERWVTTEQANLIPERYLNP